MATVDEKKAMKMAKKLAATKERLERLKTDAVRIDEKLANHVKRQAVLEADKVRITSELASITAEIENYISMLTKQTGV